MARAIEILMNEHRVIERVLGSLETFVEKMEGGVEDERSTLRDYASFFQNFVDKCHHGKEEDRLFLRMKEYGFPEESGPLVDMLAEHGEGREHVGALAAAAGNGSRPLTQTERKTVQVHALAYVRLLRAHIQKEDEILYPMAIQSLPPSVMDGLASEFEDFEAHVMTPGKHERFHTLAEYLVVAYPPDTAKMAMPSRSVSCRTHG